VRRHRALALLLAVAVGTVATPSALAYWRSSSSGTAATTLPAPLALTLTVGSPMTTLVPGASADVALVLGNPNSSAVHVSTIAIDPSAATPIAVDAAHSGCTVASLSFSSQTNGGLGWSVPARVGATNGALSVDLASAISMTSSAPNACQGATITLSLIAQG
jgi:hypothetical protein